MTKSAAIRQARNEVRLYPQGRGWVLSQWDQQVRAWRNSHEMQWGEARAARRHRRMARAYELMGHSRYDAEFLADEKPLR